MQQQIAKADSHVDNIKRFLEAGGPEGGVMLSDKEEELFFRWQFADELLRRNYFSQGTKESIVNQIMWKYEVSRAQAYRDIVNAEDVFSSSMPLNKKYIIHRRIEVLELQVSKCYDTGDVENGVKLEKELRGYIEMYPDFVSARSPNNIHYHFNQNSFTVTSKTGAEAFEEADIVLKEMEEGDEL